MTSENEAPKNNLSVPKLRSCASDPYIGRDLKDAGAILQRSKAFFEKRIENHEVDRLINPFSEFWGQNKDQYLDVLQNASAVWKDADKRTMLEKVDDKYGCPVEGSLTAERGEKAKNFIAMNIIDCCENIRVNGQLQRDGTYIIKFGVIFKVYEKINNKLVGLLVRARRHGLLEFPGEMLYQRQDDDVDIRLLKVPTYDELNLKFIAFNQKQKEEMEAAKKRKEKKLEEKREHWIR